MSLLNSDLLYAIFETFYAPPSYIQKRQTFRNIEFYRAMLEVGLNPPLSLNNSFLFHCALVCRAWKIPAQQLMRRHLRIKTKGQFKHFVSVFEICPQDGFAVHSLDFIDWRAQGGFHLNVIRLILMCPNLRTLRVQGFNFARSSGFSFHLRHLTALDLGWGCTLTKASLKAVLDGAPKLRVLATEGLHRATSGDGDSEELLDPPSCHLNAVVAYRMRSPEDFRWILSASIKSLTTFTLKNLRADPEDSGDKRLNSLFKVYFPSINNFSTNNADVLPFVVKYCSKLSHLRVLFAARGFKEWEWPLAEFQLQGSLNQIALPLHSLILCLPKDGGDICFPSVKNLITIQPALSELRYLGFEMQADRIKYVGKSRRELDKLVQICKSRSIRFEYPKPESLYSDNSDSDY